jgi:hypothetical protein
MEVKLNEGHNYTVDGKHYPSVSKILNMYFEPCQFWTDTHRETGTARHQWYGMIAQGIEVENEPDERIAAEVEGFRKFISEVKPKYIFGEVPLFDDALKVCGMPDMYCEINGRLSVCDFKPKTASDRWRLQTAAYYAILSANGHPVLDRYALRVLPGEYRLDKHEERIDLVNWRLMAVAYHARRAYK